MDLNPIRKIEEIAKKKNFLPLLFVIILYFSLWCMEFFLEFYLNCF